MSQLADIEAFVEVVDRGGFRAAARTLDLTPSAVSKRIARLEERLGVRLLNRTTRRVAATDVGRALYERGQAILQDLAEAESAVAELQGEARGRLRLGAPMDFGRRHLAEPLARFAADHPHVSLDVALTDRFVEVVGEGFDVVLRIGALPDSSLVTRRLAPCRRVLVASPAYLEERGTPTSADELAGHDAVVYAHEADHAVRVDGEPVALRERHRTDNGEMLRALLRAGQGIALLPTFLVCDDLRDGSLVELLAGRTAGDLEVHALTPHRQLLSTKVRLLLDHLREAFGPVPAWDRGI